MVLCFIMFENILWLATALNLSLGDNVDVHCPKQLMFLSVGWPTHFVWHVQV